MIRASELDGRAVVDLDAAEKLGRIEQVILNPDARRVAGFVVARGGSLFGPSAHVVVPASAVHAVGPDAVTVHHAALDRTDADVETLPRTSDIVGRKVVSTEGRLLGIIDDILINDTDGRIVGYELADGDGAAKLGHLFGTHREHHRVMLRADVPLRTGRDLIVAPADAVIDTDGDHAPAAADSSAGAREASAAAAAPTATAPGFPYSTTWFQRSDERADPDESR